jgi:hypothetical protein
VVLARVHVFFRKMDYKGKYKTVQQILPKRLTPVFYFSSREITMCAEKKKPSVKEAVSNLAKPMPLAKKLSLLVKNSTVKLVRLQNCCGHPGEPGC